MTMKKMAALSTVAMLTACPAFAGGGGGGTVIAEVDGLGGPLVMRGRTIDGVFGGVPSEFTDAALSTFNTELQNDGIVTDGHVTFLLSLTDVGITWTVLVDDQNQPGSFQSFDSVLGMSTTGPSTASRYINEDASDVTTRADLGNGTYLVAGLFNWDSVHEGDGYAWGSLLDGDSVAFSFSDEGPSGTAAADMYQFASWNGTSWEVIATADFTGNDQFAFTFSIVPSPAGLALLGVAGLTGRRRRRI